DVPTARPRARIGPRVPRKPGAHDMSAVLAVSLADELADHLQVVYGAAVALVVVVLLTPAVGGMARLLGVVDRPDGRRLNVRPIPRLGGLALFLGIIVPA